MVALENPCTTDNGATSVDNSSPNVTRDSADPSSNAVIGSADVDPDTIMDSADGGTSAIIGSASVDTNAIIGSVDAEIPSSYDLANVGTMYSKTISVDQNLNCMDFDSTNLNRSDPGRHVNQYEPFNSSGSSGSHDSTYINQSHPLMIEHDHVSYFMM